MRDRTANNTISNNPESITAWQGGRFFSPKLQSFVPLSIPIMIRENDKVRMHPVLGEIGRKWRLNSWVSSVEPKFRGPFTVGPSFFDKNGQDFWTHGVTGLPDIAFRLTGGVRGLIQNRVQEQIFIFRPCFIAPPGLVRQPDGHGTVYHMFACLRPPSVSPQIFMK